MSDTIPVHISRELYEQARRGAQAENSAVDDQIEYWARVGRTALENPDLPVSFIVEALASLSEPRETASRFVPSSRRA